MARTSEPEVRLIIKTDLIKLDGFIASANRIVTSFLGSSSLSSAELADIEAWIAAHLIAISGNDTSKNTVFKNCKDCKGLSLSTYGQTAIALDTSGELKTVGKGRAQFHVFEPSFTYNEDAT